MTSNVRTAPASAARPPEQHAQLLHLSGPLRGRTDTYAKDYLQIGTDRRADIGFPAETRGVAGRHAEITFSPESCTFHLRRIDGRVFINHVEVLEVILEPEDLIEFGLGGPRARFRIYCLPGAYCKPVRKMLKDARQVGRQSGASGFLATFLRDLLTHATKTLKVGFPLAVVLAVGFAFWAGKAFGESRVPAEAAERLRRYERELEQFRARSQQMLAAHEQLRREFELRAKIVDRMAQEDAALRHVLETLAPGVCLIAGEFMFEREANGKLEPLLDDAGKPLHGGYTGSGFLADARGWTITNRHVVEPWFHNTAVEPMLRLGFKPRLRVLRAFFPGRAPIDIDRTTIRLRTDDVDVALFRVDARDLPALPLSRVDPLTLRGARVLVLGYPAGIDGLMAKVDNAEATDIASKAPTLAEVVLELSRRQAIRPLPTQGNLNEVLARQLVFDAPTTHGGSGGPIFGPDGTVIAVTFAILENFGGENFGVPIRFAIELLP